MRKKFFAIVLTLLSILCVVVGYRFGFSNELTNIVKNEPIIIHASWDHEPEDVVELAEISDLVVIGKLAEFNKYIEPSRNTVYRKHEFQVLETLKGKNEANKIPLILHGGKNSEGVNVQWDIENITDGDYALLFLRKLDYSKDIPVDMRGSYISVSGPSSVYSLSTNSDMIFDKLDEGHSLSFKEESQIKISVKNNITELQNKIVALSYATLKELVNNQN